MAISFFHTETQRWLTSINRESKPGDEITLSIGQQLGGGEFTTYRLGAAVGEAEDGAPLFDLDDACRKVGGVSGTWATKAEIDAAIDTANSTVPRADQLVFKGVKFRRSVFGDWIAD